MKLLAYNNIFFCLFFEKGTNPLFFHQMATRLPFVEMACLHVLPVSHINRLITIREKKKNSHFLNYLSSVTKHQSEQLIPFNQWEKT